MYGWIYDLKIGRCHPRARCDLSVSPGSDSRQHARCLHDSQATVHHPVVSGFFTPCGAVLIRAISVFVTGSLQLLMYGEIYDSDMGPYHPRVRWISPLRRGGGGVSVC